MQLADWFHLRSAGTPQNIVIVHFIVPLFTQDCYMPAIIPKSWLVLILTQAWTCFTKKGNR